MSIRTRSHPVTRNLLKVSLVLPPPPVTTASPVARSKTPTRQQPSSPIAGSCTGAGTGVLGGSVGGSVSGSVGGNGGGNGSETERHGDDDPARDGHVNSGSGRDVERGGVGEGDHQIHQASDGRDDLQQRTTTSPCRDARTQWRADFGEDVAEDGRMLVENHTAHATGISGTITPPANKPAHARLVRSANRETRIQALVGAAVVGDVAGAIGDHGSIAVLSR